MKFKAILFDLDGTLLDTLTDLADSMNATLARFGFPTHPLQAYRHFVGDGIDSLVKRTLPPDRLDDETIAKALAAQKDEYTARWDRTTKPYPQIPQLLDELTSRHIPLIILSNKPHNFTLLTVEKLLPNWHFAIIQGVTDPSRKKPDPSAALKIAAELNIPPEQFLYLGDTDTDMKTANAAGMYPLGALWGFRDAEELNAFGAKALLSDPLELLRFFE